VTRFTQQLKNEKVIGRVTLHEETIRFWDRVHLVSFMQIGRINEPRRKTFLSFRQNYTLRLYRISTQEKCFDWKLDMCSHFNKEIRREAQPVAFGVSNIFSLQALYKMPSTLYHGVRQR